ncbi:MAG: O-antigen polymerase [Marinobacter sp.]|uniref:O-antigen polymerase n=1 Tax=Marinobacter sp. TaxID=50741 RepID=UPI0032973D61
MRLIKYSSWFLIISITTLASITVLEMFGIFYELALSALILVVVLFFPLFFRNVKWYEPVFAVNAMYALFALAVIYFSVSGFSRAEHAIHGIAELQKRAPLVVLYISIWLLVFYGGYLSIRKVPLKEDVDNVVSEPLKGVDPLVLKVSIYFLFLVAIANVLYNVWLFSPSDPVGYFLNFGVARHRDMVNDGIYTTLGYNLFIVGLVLFRCSFSEWSFRRSFIYFSMLVITLFAMVSRGQIFFTFSVLMFIFILEYFLIRNRRAYFRWALVLFPTIFLVMVGAYFLRLVSVEVYLSRISGDEIGWFSAFSEKLPQFMGLIFGKGNVPNLPAMIVYEDHYGGVEGFLWGESLLNWITAFVPTWNGTYIGYGISDIWYPNNVGGIPPGLIHELYANFGYFGSLVAAYIFGYLGALSFNLVSRSKSVLVFLVYSALLVRFWFILPKVEFAVLSNAIWLFIPSVISIFALIWVTYIISRIRLKGFYDSSFQ